MTDATGRISALVPGEMTGTSEQDLSERFELLKAEPDGPGRIVAERGLQRVFLYDRSRWTTQNGPVMTIAVQFEMWAE